MKPSFAVYQALTRTCLVSVFWMVTMIVMHPVTGLAATTDSVPLTVWTVTGESHSGELIPGESTHLTMREGDEVRSMPLADVWQLAVLPRSRPLRRPPFWLHGNRGDRLAVTNPRLIDEELEFTLPFQEEPQRVGLGEIVGLQPVRPAATWRTDDAEWRQVLNRRIRSDLIVLRNGDQPAWEITGLDRTSVQMLTPQGDKAWEWSSVMGMRLNPDLADPVQPLPSGILILLADESWVTAATVDLSQETHCRIILEPDRQWEVPWEHVRWMAPWGAVGQPLSQLPVARQRHQPQLGEAYQVGVNRNVQGLPLRVRIREPRSAGPKDIAAVAAFPELVPLGLGLSSGMTVEWKLDGQYRRLLSGLVLDATACELGQAELTWITDNHPPVTTSIRSGDLPSLHVIDLSGSQTLTIETREGGDGDACDWINLLAPLLVQ